jgi:hypothetical protein
MLEKSKNGHANIWAFFKLNFIATYHSIADPGCLFRIPDPDFYPSRIPDPNTATKKEGEKKICCHTFFCSLKFQKILNYFIFEMPKKKFGPILKELQHFLPKKLSLSSQKYGFGIRDPGSEIRDPGVKKAPDPGSGSATLQITLGYLNKIVSKLWFCAKKVTTLPHLTVFGS